MLQVIEELTIAVSAEMLEQVREAVENGEYKGASEIVHEALQAWTSERLLRQRGAVSRLKELWEEGSASTEPGVPADDVFDALERKYQAMADTQGALQ